MNPFYKDIPNQVFCSVLNTFLPPLPKKNGRNPPRAPKNPSQGAVGKRGSSQPSTSETEHVDIDSEFVSSANAMMIIKI